ncbi:MAG: 2-phospho-L-lactate transferase [Pseudomonadota bacterium]
MSGRIRVTLLAGGVGGAKMAEGFAACDAVELSVIGNVADDAEFHGLWVSPDIDTMLYTLSGRINRDQGWGVADEGQRALDVLDELGADTWMFLGDKDFGLHIYRTDRMRHGHRPQDITRDIAERFGIAARVLLPTDDQVQTRVKTPDGWLGFQEYFVRQRCEPMVTDIVFEGIGDALPTTEALDALEQADLIVIAPSNPLVSIAPILSVGGIEEAIRAARAPVIAVSPLIAGRVVKGPADRMMRAMGMRADAVGVAQRYADLADALVIDHADEALVDEIDASGVQAICRDILMPDATAKERFANDLIAIYRQGLGDAAA